ncbi:KAP family P-loop NTPase fold protein [Aurantiacibacter poecillastricola]|uniref:KAP family P-loop NTPase fold protein n=1 Tax=Aurantiacibacter poecillastricola TaxID=3064385 RepID=UPI00273EC31A|nr:P-loop NTPase fold protein [Aurantiacibacter sp. 219JJ12-13]MDP5261661.1 P-loop NTPase fold protein [Aurantiacibacter sp. 219JJ12-13]
MTDKILDIWEGDRLGRMGEALMLERHIQERVARRSLNRESESYILAIDAPYGEGKSWFLQRFCKQLGLRHPVARIDAWIDDANNEPMVALMAAINEALAPYLTKDSKIASRFNAVKRAALPIISKAVVGGASKFAQKHLGDDFLDEVLFEIEAQEKPNSNEKDSKSDAIDGVIASAESSVADLIDRHSAKLIEDYTKRAESRDDFKNNMRALLKALEKETSGACAPLFVVIDELDRCRPDYAISLLEKVKHLFDIENVVFIMAMNADQLERGISAVYGEKFDSKDYLRRFFSRKYELRKLSVEEIVMEEFRLLELDEKKFFVPHLDTAGCEPVVSAPKFISLALDEMKVTPREASRVMDALALFHDQWIIDLEIELVALLPMIVHLVRAEPISMDLGVSNDSLYLRGISSNGAGKLRPILFKEVATRFSAVSNNPLPQLAAEGATGAASYVGERFAHELARLHGNGWPNGRPPRSVILSYADNLRLIERFTDDIADEFESGRWGEV